METRFLIISVLALVLLAGLSSAAVIAEWNFESETLNPSTDITSNAILAVKTNGTVEFPAGNAPSLANSVSSNNWNTNDNFEIKLRTTGYEDIILKFDDQASDTGTKEFKIQYSSDGTNFVDLPGSIRNTSSSFTLNPMHTFSFLSITSIDNNANTIIRIISTADANSSAGTWRIDNLRIEGTSISSQVDWKDNFCLFEDGVSGNPGSLKIKVSDVTVTGFGEDNDWFPFDEIEVTVNVEVQGRDDVDNIEVEWGIYDNQNDQWIIDVDNEKDIDLRDGDDEDVTFTFKIDNKDLDIDVDELEDGDNYVLYVRATGDVDNTANDATCKASSRNINMIIEKDFVILRNIELPESVSCGSTVQITGDVWNVGSRDQDSVSMRISANGLNINQLADIGDINSLDSESFDVSLKIPSDAEEKSYTLVLEVYDEDKGIFTADNDDEEARENFILKVDSCSASGNGNNGGEDAVVSANIVSGGKAGQELVVKSTLKNTGSKDATYLINAAGYAGWASLSDLNPDTLTLKSGESDDVMLTFAVNKQASGEQTFDIEVLSGNSLVVSQPVSVTIEKSGTSLNEIFGDNWYIWVIVLANVVLLVLIIVIAVRVSRKK
ncbi:MAG: putative S-layer protein [Nanoarchaeota archaeon]